MSSIKRKQAQNTDQQLCDLVVAMALCHNVTPTIDEDTGEKRYQASSPDEVALVETTGRLGVELIRRDQRNLILEVCTPQGQKSELRYDILNVFPFSSETKRMGIVLRNSETRQISFYLKGADSIV